MSWCMKHIFYYFFTVSLLHDYPLFNVHLIVAEITFFTFIFQLGPLRRVKLYILQRFIIMNALTEMVVGGHAWRFLQPPFFDIGSSVEPRSTMHKSRTSSSHIFHIKIIVNKNLLFIIKPTPEIHPYKTLELEKCHNDLSHWGQIERSLVP